MTKRDLSKLVRVQRTVTRRGRTYQQFYYVKPADVKATDTIVGNQQVLDEYKKVKAQGVNATEKLNIAKFNTLRYSGDRELAFKYAEACGIQWKKCSHPGIDWMRMVMAVDKKSNGELKKALRATTGKGLISNRQNRIKREINSTANFDSLSGKNKVRVLKSALFSYNDLPELAGLLGVTWKVSTDPAINNMRVQVALSKYMENINAQTFTDTLSAKLADVNTKVKSKQLEKLKKAEEERKKKEEEERKRKEEEARKKAEEEERKRKAEEEAKKKAEEEAKRKAEEEKKKKEEEEEAKKKTTTGNPFKALAEMDEKTFNHSVAQGKVRTIELLLNTHGDIEKLKPLAEKLGIDTTGLSLSKVKSALTDYFENSSNTLDDLFKKLGLEEERKAFLNKDNTEKSEDNDILEDADEAKVVASGNASQRVKNLTDLINKVTSQKDLDLIAKSGIIPEDDKAKTYTTSLLDAYNANVRGSGSTTQLNPFDYISSVRSDYKVQSDILKDLKKAVPGLDNSDFFSVNCKELTSGFLGGDYVHFNTTTLPFSLVKGHRPNGYNTLLSNFDRDLYMNYRTAHDGGEALYEVIKDIDISYNDYSNDTKFVSITSDYNNQYGNPKVDENEFASCDINKTGMVKVLDKISKAYPEYKEEGQNLIQEYKDMLKDCDNVPAVLHNVLHYNSYSEFEETRNVLKRNIEIAQYMDNYFSKFNLTKEEYYSLINGALPRQLGSYNIADVPDIPNTEFVVYKSGSTGYSMGAPYKSIPLDNNFKEGLKTIIDKYSSIIPPYFNSTNSNGMYYTSPKDTEGYLVNVDSAITSFLRAKADGRKEKYYTQAQESLNKIDIKKYNKIYKDILDFQGCKVYNPETQQFFDDNNYDDSMSEVKSNLYAGALALVNAYDDDKTTKRNNILANVRFLRNKDRLLTSVEKAVNSASASVSNNNGKNKSQQYSYCNPRVILSYRNADTITQSGGKVRRYSTDLSNDISLEDLTHKMEEQLSNSEVLSPASLRRIQDLTDTQAHAILVTRQSTFSNSNAYMMGNFASRENYMQTAYGELYANALGEMTTYTPHAIRTSKKKGEYVDTEFAKKSIYKKLGYTSYDDKVAQANATPDTQKAQHTLLKKLRTDALKKVHCSLASLSDAKEKEIEHYVKMHWDTDGTEKQGSEQRGYAKGVNKSFANISAEFVTGAYKINNQEMDDILAEQAKAKSQTPQLYFHGTTKAGVCGIIGVDGKFKYKKNNGRSANGTSSNGAMLGHGIYLADCAGKSAKYFNGYSYRGGSHGALFLCNAIMGKNVVEKGYGNSYNDPNSDSVFMAQGTKYGSRMFPRTLMANEWCVRDTNFLAPQYVVDMACVKRK